MSISIDKKKTEAIERMKLLKIYEPAIQQFEKEGLVGISEPHFGAIYWADGRELNEIRVWEREHNALVYAVVRSFTTIGQMDSYLFVSDYEEEWEYDREALKNGEVFAYVVNRSMPDCSEFGTIGVKLSSGAGLIRVW